MDAEIKTYESRKVAIWHENDRTRTTLCSAIRSLNHQVGYEGTEGSELIERVVADPEIDLILCGLKLGKKDGVHCLLEIAKHRPVPAIIATHQNSLKEVEKALEDHVMAYLVEPVSVAELRPTIHLVLKRFDEFQNLKDEIVTLKEQFEARKTIERAKGVIMRRKDVNEESAYAQLRKFAMDSRIKLIDAAQKVLQLESARA